MEKRVKIPMVADLKNAISMYYEKIELTTKDIRELFNCSKSKAFDLKTIARQKEFEDGVKVWDASRINTQSAFRAWGFDIDDLEARYSKLRKLKVI